MTERRWIMASCSPAASTRGLSTQRNPHRLDATLEVIRKRAGNAPVYITFDVDCLDPAHAPGTGTPVIGGLASWQALELLRGLDGLNLIGMDVVEVSPPYDHAEITALAAATMAYEWLCLLAKSKGAAPKPYGRD